MSLPKGYTYVAYTRQPGLMVHIMSDWTMLCTASIDEPLTQTSRNDPLCDACGFEMAARIMENRLDDDPCKLFGHDFDSGVLSTCHRCGFDPS